MFFFFSILHFFFFRFRFFLKKSHLLPSSARDSSPLLASRRIFDDALVLESWEASGPPSASASASDCDETRRASSASAGLLKSLTSIAEVRLGFVVAAAAVEFRGRGGA